MKGTNSSLKDSQVETTSHSENPKLISPPDHDPASPAQQSNPAIAGESIVEKTLVETLSAGAEDVQTKQEPIPKEVYEILMDEYKKGHRIIISRLYSKIKKKLNVDARKALNIINMLVKTKEIRENSLIIKTIVLENERRKKIYDIVGMNPGIYFTLLKSILCVGSKVLNHHLRILIELDLVHEDYIEGKRAFFSDASFLQYKKFFVHIKMEQSRRIIAHVLNNDGNNITIEMIASKLGMKYSNANYHVKQLVDAGIFSQNKAVNPNLYS
nr:hypothetical protein [Candidatus Sigynarchaeota archaeon]